MSETRNGPVSSDRNAVSSESSIHNVYTLRGVRMYKNTSRYTGMDPKYLYP